MQCVVRVLQSLMLLVLIDALSPVVTVGPAFNVEAFTSPAPTISLSFQHRTDKGGNGKKSMERKGTTNSYSNNYNYVSLDAKLRGVRDPQLARILAKSKSGNNFNYKDRTVQVSRSRRSTKVIALVTASAAASVRAMYKGSNYVAVAQVVAASLLGAAMAWILRSRSPVKPFNLNRTKATPDSNEILAALLDQKSQTTNKAWVSNRLGEVKEIDRVKMENYKAELEAKEAQRKAKAQQWATSTLKATDEAFQRGEQERKSKTEAQHMAEIWADSVARESKANDPRVLERDNNNEWTLE